MGRFYSSPFSQRQAGVARGSHAVEMLGCPFYDEREILGTRVPQHESENHSTPRLCDFEVTAWAELAQAAVAGVQGSGQSGISIRTNVPLPSHSSFI